MAAQPAAAVPAPRTLNGPDRVAALLLAMGKPAASRLLKHFEPGDLKEIARAAAGLGMLQPPDVELLVEDFSKEFAAGVNLLGTAEEVEKLLTGILPGEQISDIMADVLGQNKNNVWERASEAAEGALVSFLKSEHPQTAALILSKVAPATAAKVVGQMPEASRNNLMRRMATMKPVLAPAMRLVEGGMSEALTSVLGQSAVRETNVRIADILNRMEHDQIDAILGNIAELRPDTAKALKRLLFRFEDIVKLTPKDRMAVFDQVAAEQIVLCLQGTDAEFRESVLSTIASRARRMVEHELENGGEPDLRAVTEARRQICDRVMELAGRGEIELNASENDEA